MFDKNKKETLPQIFVALKHMCFKHLSKELLRTYVRLKQKNFLAT